MSEPAPQAHFSIAVVEDRDGRLLFLRRSPAARLGPGLWGFPAGHIETGETPRACIERELCEEIGADHHCVLARALGPVRDSLYGGIYEIHLFHYRWRHGTVILNEEHTAFAWVEPEGFAGLEVMDGIDEDLYLLGVWPRRYLNRARLPESMRREV